MARRETTKPRGSGDTMGASFALGRLFESASDARRVENDVELMDIGR